MVDINSITSRGKVKYSSKQLYFPLDYNFLLRTQTGQFQCSYCGVFVCLAELSRDHTYPKSKGGNRVTSSCKPCNNIKKDMLPIEWALYAFRHKLDFAPKFTVTEDNMCG